MRKLLLSSLVFAAAVAAFASLASGQESAGPTYKLSATLSAAQAIPHAKGALAGATGHFTATLVGGKLKWRLTFAHLTGRATAHSRVAGLTGRAGVTAGSAIRSIAGDVDAHRARAHGAGHPRRRARAAARAAIACHQLAARVTTAATIRAVRSRVDANTRALRLAARARRGDTYAARARLASGALVVTATAVIRARRRVHASTSRPARFSGWRRPARCDRS